MRKQLQPISMLIRYHTAIIAGRKCTRCDPLSNPACARHQRGGLVFWKRIRRGSTLKTRTLGASWMGDYTRRTSRFSTSTTHLHSKTIHKMYPLIRSCKVWIVPRSSRMNLHNLNALIISDHLWMEWQSGRRIPHGNPAEPPWTGPAWHLSRMGSRCSNYMHTCGSTFESSASLASCASIFRITNFRSF